MDNGKTLLETFVIMQGALNKEVLGKTLCSNDKYFDEVCALKMPIA